jgi:hypothetical protein
MRVLGLFDRVVTSGVFVCRLLDLCFKRVDPLVFLFEQ